MGSGAGALGAASLLMSSLPLSSLSLSLSLCTQRGVLGRPVLVLQLPLATVIAVQHLGGNLPQDVHEESRGLIRRLLNGVEAPVRLPLEQLEQPVHERLLVFHLDPLVVRLLPSMLPLVLGSSHVRHGERHGFLAHLHDAGVAQVNPADDPRLAHASAHAGLLLRALPRHREILATHLRLQGKLLANSPLYRWVRRLSGTRRSPVLRESVHAHKLLPGGNRGNHRVMQWNPV
mmetsp:Transcript_23785/g.50944  ORF Transcript_23785/g.50944 Transcript_23785/m.50944 type:complete len:232 (-) Transcript_23785:177-872(-)